MAQTFAQMGFSAAVKAASATPATDGYIGMLGVLPYHIHPIATPEPWAALQVAIAASLVTVAPYVAPVITPPTPAQAQAALIAAGKAALTASDVTMTRITEATIRGKTTLATADVVAFATWRAAVRAIVDGSDTTSTALPAKPPYPANT